MYKKQKLGRRFGSSFSSSLLPSRIAILFILLIFSLSLSIISMLNISQHQQAMAQTNTTTTPSQATNNTTKDAFSTYENTTYGIKIQYPAGFGWQPVPSNKPFEANAINYIVAFRSPPDRVSDTVIETVNIALENLPPEENILLDAYSTLQISILTQSATDFDLKESTPTILAGIPAHKIVYSETLQQLPITVMQVWAIKDNKAYILTYTAEAAKYSTYLPVVQKMFDSFELIGSTSGANNSTVQSTTTNQ
jgi:serine/threonine-protein kinase